MEKVKRMRLTHRRQLEDVPELINQIQALLPAKDAARTCVLSKSWLHAWSTIPTLRFCQSRKSLTKQQEKGYLRLIRRTIRRYHRDNIPIITCDIHFGIHKPKSFKRDTRLIRYMPELSFIDSIGSLREIHLSRVTIDDYGLCNIINTKFPFLESLTLDIMWCRVGSLDFRSNSLQRLKISSSQTMLSIPVQVYAPRLLFFWYKGFGMPNLLFPIIAPEQIELALWVNTPIDHLFFLKLREYLNLSSKFNIVIRSFESAVLAPFNIDDVRTRVLFPATNVEKLSFETFRDDDGLVENSVLLFDALFSICLPLYVEAHLQMRLKAADYFLNLIDTGLTGKSSGNCPDLNCCEIRNGLEGEWEALTSSSLSLLPEWSQCMFKLGYCSP